jgi:hypothetical protein
MRPGSLPHVLAGSASALDGFGTCSMFIRITACSLADSLYRSLLHRGLRTVHCFPARLDCYRLERKLPGGIKLSHWGSAPFHGAQARPCLRRPFSNTSNFGILCTPETSDFDNLTHLIPKGTSRFKRKGKNFNMLPASPLCYLIGTAVLLWPPAVIPLSLHASGTLHARQPH